MQRTWDAGTGTLLMPLRADRLQSSLPEPGPEISLGGWWYVSAR